MTLHIADKWIWDFWFAQDGADYHIFFLQADRALGNEHLRHHNARMGHAVSQDLRHWELLPNPFTPSKQWTGAEPFDSGNTWTGSVIRHEGLWYMFYTGSMASEDSLVQRVGLATSPDLMTWTKHPDNPLISADPQWYEELDLTLWHDQAWRDPHVFWDDESGKFHALITGRVNTGAADGRGVIAHAQSSDLIKWDVLPPVTQPGEFGQMEVPQYLHIGGRHYLLFCTSHHHHSAVRRQRIGNLTLDTGTHYLMSDKAFEGYQLPTDHFFAGDGIGSLYSGKLIQDPAGEWKFMAFHNYLPDGGFVGDVSDPLPVHVDADGLLSVEIPVLT
jgi:beta-fructofuranosidase